MLGRSSPALGIVVVAMVTGCGDLFHGTDWQTACDLDASTPGCPVGAGGAHAASTPASSGAAGGGGASSHSSSSGKGSANASSSSGAASSTGAGGGVSIAGCADGTREGFVDMTAHPTIAACSGGFSVPGVSTSPTCARVSGNDSTNPTGIGCASGDLCAAGWHVCTSPADVMSHSANGCTDAAASTTSVFFVTQASGAGLAMCATSGHNDLFGCGNLGSPPDPTSCAPLDEFSGDLCAALGAPWDCGADDLNEASNVKKSGPLLGGVICCTD